MNQRWGPKRTKIASAPFYELVTAVLARESHVRCLADIDSPSQSGNPWAARSLRLVLFNPDPLDNQRMDNCTWPPKSFVVQSTLVCGLEPETESLTQLGYEFEAQRGQQAQDVGYIAFFVR